MLKKERLLNIMDMVNTKGIITVNEIIESLKISDMTARRDLDELENSGKLVRIHGGAQSIAYPRKGEKSNAEKLSVQIKEKKEIAKTASKLVKDGETIFIGPGTTLEFFAEQLVQKQLRIITNSLPVFTILKNSPKIDLILIGGEYREITGAFVGSLTNQSISSLKFSKTFISCNGIYGNDIATYNEAEGEIQKLALDNSFDKFVLVDSQKFNTYDFSVFYQLDQINHLITDATISKETLANYQTFTDIIIAQK